MLSLRHAVVPLRALLVLLFSLLVLLQVMSLPGQFLHLNDEEPDRTALWWGLWAITEGMVLCAQVVVVATWKLLTRVQEDRIFDERSLVWVDAIVGAVLGGFALLGSILVILFFTHDDPGLPLLITVLLVGAGVVALLVVVLRALLRQATTLRTDLEGVI